MCPDATCPPASVYGRHIRFKAEATGLRPKGDSTKLQMLCPVHGDRRRSLTVSAADHDGKRIVWFCHRGCPELAVREALISQCHIPPGCLPPSRDQAPQLLAAVIAELSTPSRQPAQKIIRALSAALGYKEIPHGAQLEHLAAMAGIARSSAFRAAGKKRG